METREFLRRYAWVYLYVAAFFLFGAGLLRHAVETAGPMECLPVFPVIVIDAGHGAPDGGAVGISGIREDEINLAVAKRLEAMLALLGYDAVTTRTGPDSIATEGETIRQKKQSDLRNRVKQVNAQASAVVVSVHQNHFSDSRYSGPQVFYADGGEALAKSAQEALSAVLAPGSKRESKPASGIYLMEHIAHPGILVECGFLSNPDEERKLATPAHQKKIAATLAAVLARYVVAGV